MSDFLYEKHAELCQAVAHPKRLELLDLLRDGERCVCEMAPLLGIRQANLSQHLSILRTAGVVVTRRSGPSVYYRVRDPRIFEAIDTMRSVIREQFLEASELLEAGQTQ